MACTAGDHSPHTLLFSRLNDQVLLYGAIPTSATLSRWWDSSSFLALQLCAESGLLVVGHDRGDLRVYQFSTASQEVRAMAFDGRRRAQDEEEIGIPRSQQPPGFQRILQVRFHKQHNI